MMSPVVGETALSGFPTYALPPAGCSTLNGSLASVSRASLTTGPAAAVSRATPTVCGYTPQNTGATLGKALASVRFLEALVNIC